MRIFLTLLLCAFAAFAPPAQADMPSCSEEIQRGVASWYGPGFEGMPTKSSELYDPAALSAAHDRLPFGTVIRVLNLRNHKSVLVEVNDRGKFDRERVIDLSQGAAREIDMIDDGIVPVAIFRCNP